MTQVYTTLISGPDDVPGALAYVVYKRMKIEWRAHFHATYSRQPDASEEKSFVQIQMLPANIASLKQQGELVAAEFLQEVLSEKMATLAIKVSQSELAEKFAALDANVTSSLQRIQIQLDEKKTIGGWMKDIGTAFVSSPALAAIVGSILTGYVGLAKLTATTEKAVGIGANPAHKPALGEPVFTPSAPQERE
ncbi:hypothetical protein [Massilia antarctica]|uniref:hypothetical protein n=1 Tax=Massilia antarctica TaxID=2765360 RepID=UPI0006BB94B0|nr:hypothetical protein [Massilia sp. H27-R4]MCY0912118.1 hypothetical protein [Massilia sp. H27-R4]CUI06410.1 hypothetical protein BN2497_7597 [Janthinobacterium sp. CG23_2]CUU30196.1 hypothetical protein BN3177_7597 [Janthinobacterium sp. CG23_2]